MWIRYFASIDESELGRAAAAYCDHLVRTGMPVRLVSTRTVELQDGGMWSRHRRLLLTPMDGQYVNAVCGELSDWARYHTPSASKNLLLLCERNLDARVPRGIIKTAVDHYDAVYALTPKLAEAVANVTGKAVHVAPAGMRWAT